MKDEVDIAMFREWEQHPVTMRLKEVLKEWDDDLISILLNPNLILKEDGQIKYLMTVGQREIIDILLSLSITELQQPKEDESYVIRDDSTGENGA